MSEKKLTKKEFDKKYRYREFYDYNCRVCKYGLCASKCVHSERKRKVSFINGSCDAFERKEK